MTGEKVIPLRTETPVSDIPSDAILDALPTAIILVDPSNNLLQVNTTAEQLFKASADVLIGENLASLLPEDSPLFSLISQVVSRGVVVAEYELTLDTPRMGKHVVDARAAPVGDPFDGVVLSLQHRSIAETIDRQLTHRGAARSVSAMASMLAHEVKNPLSGIRGAAQLLEQNAPAEDKTLTSLIRDETDRICDLVDRMGVFSDAGPLQRAAVNIHQVLDRVHQLAKNGFGRQRRFQLDFDPSLPPVYGNLDQLVQVFLNLVKNACEATSETGGEVILQTAYQQGVRFAVPGAQSRVHLPLVVRIIDNGPGIPEDIQAHLFDPFVTSKPNGSGLGLALVAKIVGDHGGIIEYENVSRQMVFKVMLPMAPGPAEPKESGS